MNIIAIDPGLTGGIAWTDEDGTPKAIAMPEGMTEQADFIRSIRTPDCIAIMERTGTYQPGNSGPASVTFARHCGHLDAILYLLGIPTEQVAPQTWMKMLGSLPKEKKDRKLAIKEWAARNFPHLSVTLKTADALSIYAWRSKQIPCSNESPSQTSKAIVKRRLILKKAST
jgi:hypothetical protein